MTTIADTLRARWRPEYATRIPGGSHAFDTALSFVGAGAAKRAELEKRGTLSPKGIAEEVLWPAQGCLHGQRATRSTRSIREIGYRV